MEYVYRVVSSQKEYLNAKMINTRDIIDYFWKNRTITNILYGMKDSVTLSLRGNMSFDAEINGHKLVIDTGELNGGNDEGPRPKSLMLVALGGCTGMDMASILRKMRVPFENIRVKVDGNITEEHPKHFDTMHITYYIKGTGLDKTKVEQAAKLSKDNYCGVSYNYKASIVITHEIIYEE
jgi:putative redox protein